MPRIVDLSQEIKPGMMDQVAGSRFTFIGLPLKLKGAHGGPMRAVGVLDD